MNQARNDTAPCASAPVELLPNAISLEALKSKTVAVPKSTYGQILKSSALIGSASVINIGFGIVRTKAMALLLGPAGVGLMGLYSSIAELAQCVATMGLNSSGVRQIAEAAGSGQAERIARTATVLRRISVLLGIIGALLLVILSRQISSWTFGTDERWGGVALLSLAVFFGAITGGQSALIQGLRRIGDLARIGILGALFGTLVSIPVVYFFREKGIVPSLVTVAAIASLTSWWYGRKVKIQIPSLTMAQVRKEATDLLKLGSAFMVSAILTLGAAYLVRLIVVRKIGLEAAGIYQSAWVLGGLYIGFILQAMGSDFYPRLTAVCGDNRECNRLVNEQALVGLLIAGPGVLATLTFAPVVVEAFYSAQFKPAVEILRWICLGMTLRVVAWPMGYIVLAKGEQKIFFWTEIAATVVHIGLAWFCIDRFQLTGAGAAFFGLYIWHGLLIYWITRRLSGFQWSTANRRTGMLFFSFIALVFFGLYVLPFWIATSIGVVALLFSSYYSIRTLAKLVSHEQLPPFLQKLFHRFGFLSAA